MDKSKQATDIDRKLAIYYHPLFQEVIKNILLLFKIPQSQTFEIGLLEFVEFNLKLQKSLLPSFELENALVSALNDWVKQVAECLSYEGMVSTNKCEEITPDNFQTLLDKQMASMYIEPFAQKNEVHKILGKLSNHDAFKLLGVKINKEVFNKFMFDLCSTWCEFLDIELFSYFLIAIYIQISQGASLSTSSFRTTTAITPIDLEFMEEFEEIKAMYSKNRKKDLRYYRAWCEWNYLRINEVGEALILQLDQIHQNDPRILELALVFEKAIQVINDEITNQNQPKIEPNPPTLPFQVSKTQEKQGDFLIAKKIGVSIQRQQQEQQLPQLTKQSKIDEISTEEELIHDFQIEIDADGNMFLKKVVKMPIFGTKIELQPYERKQVLKLRYIQRKKQEIRQLSNLYRRMENMKVRLEHNVKNDHYSYKQAAKIVQREQFYQKQESEKLKDNKNQYTNMPVDKIIHGKIPPSLAQPLPSIINKDKQDYKKLFKQQLLEEKQPIRKNQEYAHKVMAPSFLTDQKNNIVFGKGESSIYGVGPYAEKRDIKLGLPKLRHLSTHIEPIGSYHIVGKLVKDRAAINQRVKSFSVTQPPLNRIEKERQEYKHVWHRYISQQQMGELTNYRQFYSKLEAAKQQFSKDYQSQYRLNLKQILLYDNKRYEMGGIIDRKQEEQFYERIRKLIKRDEKRVKRKKRRTKLREYRKAVGTKEKRKLFEDIFISYHRSVIKEIKQERQQASMIK